MKIKLFLFYISVGLFLILSSCKDAANEPAPVPAENYFPISEGTNFNYSIEGTDSVGNIINGNRSSYFIGGTNLGGTDYSNQFDSLTLNGLLISSQAFVRKTDNGVYYFLDTTGLYTSIPDSFRSGISLDPEFILYSFPLESGKFWTAFKMTLTIPPFIANFTPLEVTAFYEGVESGLIIPLSSGNITSDAERIRYELLLRESIDPFITPKKLTAYSWIVKDIGVVKWEGNETVVNALSSAYIDFDDSVNTITENLINYEIK